MDLKVKKLYESKTGMWPKVKLSSWRDTNQGTKGLLLLAGAHQSQNLRGRPTGHILEAESARCQHQHGSPVNLSLSCIHTSVRSQWPEVQCSFDPYL